MQHQKQTQYSMLQIKTYSQKHISTLAILLLLHHPSFYFLTTISEGPYKRSEETTQRKHTYVTPIFLANNKLSLATNKPTPPAKLILQKTHIQNTSYKIEQNPDITPQLIAVQCQRSVNLKYDSQMVQRSVTARHAVNAIQKQKNPMSPSSTQKKPSSACWNCGGWYFARKCPFNTHRCLECKKQGH